MCLFEGTSPPKKKQENTSNRRFSFWFPFKITKKGSLKQKTHPYALQKQVGSLSVSFAFQGQLSAWRCEFQVISAHRLGTLWWTSVWWGFVCTNHFFGGSLLFKFIAASERRREKKGKEKNTGVSNIGNTFFGNESHHQPLKGS